MHAATIELVDERGYAGLTVAAIVEKAGVSKHTFYENFNDKEDCFLATYRVIVRQTAREILFARQRERGYRARVRAGFLAFSQQVAKQPMAARLALISILEGGGAAKEARFHTSGLFETLVADSLAEEEDGVALPPILVKGIVAGAIRVAQARLLAGQEADLPDAADGLVGWVFSLRNEVAMNACLVGAHAGTSSMAVVADGKATNSGVRREQSIGDERAMILSAFAQLAMKGQFEALTVAGIRRAAGISRRCFEQHFDSVAECLFATLEQRAEGVLAEARSAFYRAGEWPVGVYLAVSRLCEGLARDPVLTSLSLFELPVSGPEAVKWETDLVGELCDLLWCAVPPRERPTRLVAEASVGAVSSLVYHHVVAGKAQRLPSIAGAVTYLLLAPSIDAERAASVIDGSHADSPTIARNDDQERFGQSS